MYGKPYDGHQTAVQPLKYWIRIYREMKITEKKNKTSMSESGE